MQAKEREIRRPGQSYNKRSGKVESPSAVDFNRFSSIPEDFEASNMPPPPENMADIP